jgi:hypothetical protein
MAKGSRLYVLAFTAAFGSFVPAASEIHRRCSTPTSQGAQREEVYHPRTSLSARAHFSALIYECELFGNMSITSEAGKLDADFFFVLTSRREAKREKNQFAVESGAEAK